MHNPVNDEISPLNSFDPGFDDEPEIPLLDMKLS